MAKLLGERKQEPKESSVKHPWAAPANFAKDFKIAQALGSRWSHFADASRSKLPALGTRAGMRHRELNANLMCSRKTAHATMSIEPRGGHDQ
jgi:hypothetical protein